MIDNAAIFLFSSLIIYTVFRAVKLDRMLPWFSNRKEASKLPPSKQSLRK